MVNKNILLNGKVVLITGCAGFIGAALINELLMSSESIHIIGIDNINSYYDTSLKKYRLNEIYKKITNYSSNNFTFIEGNIAEKNFVQNIFAQYGPAIVINLAAQAGVRYSIENPDAYVESNIIGFFNVLEACRFSFSNRDKGVEHLLFASSSSVYGNNKRIPYSTDDKTDYPVSLYAATKKADELMAYAYAKLYGIATTGLRFFTVYGPAGRPDMAYFNFTNKLVRGETIKIYNYGNCKRDFTYIDDVVTGIRAIMQFRPLMDDDKVRYKIYNIGNNTPVNLIDFIYILIDELKKTGVLATNYDIKNHIQFADMQPGDVEITCADISELERDFAFKPSTDLKKGLHKFAKWYSNFYKCDIEK